MPTISKAATNWFLAPVIFIVHFIYQCCAGEYLFELAGGIKRYTDGRWTEYGGIDWAWETPLYTPSCYWMAKNAIPGCVWTGGPWDLLSFLGVTVLIAIATAQVIQKVVNSESNIFGNYYWRLIVILLGWVFVPVPVEMALAYQFTVLC
jgi:hypothetical protein